ncbi:hypothetical protein [Streptomyces sp. NPDC020917]|uniref:hypothetical protein n=1 Tax=Streptomyces sp. NPDC020917 TaxID=3365102 RepID=UPI00378A0445
MTKRDAPSNTPRSGPSHLHSRCDVLDLEDHGPIESGTWERSRATAYDVIRATEIHRYAAVLCENVVEFATYCEVFEWWRTGMHHVGYTSQIVSVSSAHIGGAGNLHAPQWRDRI